MIGDPQWLTGYCLLLVEDPAVEGLSQGPRAKRSAYLEDVADLGETVQRACTAADPAVRRVNLEILGNADAFLHTHVWPRYEWEPPDLVNRPVWLYRWRGGGTRKPRSVPSTTGCAPRSPAT